MACATTCGGACWTSGCTGACATKACAFHACQSSCTGGCGGGCKGCGSGCASGCTGCGSGCASGCNTTCKATCDTLCNSSCSNSTATSLASLTLAEFIENTNMQNIQTLLAQEAARRPDKSITSLTFTEGNSATAASMTTLLANLKAIGKTSSYVATAGETIAKALGQDIITKALAASKETVNLS